MVLLVRAEFRAFVQLKAAFLEADYLTWGENDADSAEPPLAVTLQRERTESDGLSTIESQRCAARAPPESMFQGRAWHRDIGLCAETASPHRFGCCFLAGCFVLHMDRICKNIVVDTCWCPYGF